MKKEKSSAMQCETKEKNTVDVFPPTKVGTWTPWQVFLEDFGDTKGLLPDVISYYNSGGTRGGSLSSDEPPFAGYQLDGSART